MSAPLAKSDFTFKLATSQSYIDGNYDPHPLPGTAGTSRGPGRALADGLAALISRVKAWAERQATLSEMETMSERELADIGLTRSDVGRVYEAAFIAEHARNH